MKKALLFSLTGFSVLPLGISTAVWVQYQPLRLPDLLTAGKRPKSIEYVYNANKSMKVIIYCRKSSESEDRQVLSLDSQKTEMIKLCKDRGLTVVDILEESKSAKAPGRPIFTTMLDRIEKGEAEVIVAWLPDRLSRNAVDTGKLVHFLDTCHLIQIITPLQTFQNTPNDKFLFQILCAQAKLENDNKRENVLRGMRTKAEQGWYPFRAPPGYLNTPQYQKGQKIIEVDPVRFLLIRKLWDMLLTGTYTRTQLVDISNNQWGYRNPKGKKLSRSGLYELFQNPFYYGIYTYNGNVIQGKHKPMVTKDEFDKAQKILKRKDVSRPSKHKPQFSGLVHCKYCGFSVSGSVKVKTYKKTNRTAEYTSYRCSHMNKSKICKETPISETEMYNQFVAMFGSIEVDKDFLDWAVQYYDEVYAYEQQHTQAVQQSKEQAKAITDKKLATLLDMRLSGELTPEEYQQKKTELTQDKTILNSESATESSWYQSSIKAFTVAYLAQQKFKDGGYDDRRAMIKETNSDVFLQDGLVLPELEKPYFLFKTMKNTEEVQNIKFEPVKESYLSSQTLNLALQNPTWYP